MLIKQSVLNYEEAINFDGYAFLFWKSSEPDGTLRLSDRSESGHHQPCEYESGKYFSGHQRKTIIVHQ